MLKLRDTFIKEKFGKKEDWKNINEDQYVVSELDEEALYKKMFPNEADLEAYYEYRKKWFTQGSTKTYGEKPLSINCEIVSTCNLACSMCYTISKKFQNSVVGAQRMMPWKILTGIIDEAAREKIPSMSFSWRGESTLYRSYDENNNLKTFPDVLKYAREKGILEITCLTHGQLIDDKMAEAIVDAEPTWINFSIDGLKKNYNNIRTPGNKFGTDHNAFQDVVDAIKRLTKFKKKKKLTRPVIRTNTIFPAVLNDFNEYRDFFTKIGVEFITVNEIFDYRFESAPDSLIRKDWYCQFPFQRLTISANGIIIPCTGAVNEEENLVIGKIKGSKDKVVRDYKGNITKSNLDELSLMDAWHSIKINSIREMHKNNKRTEITPGCKNCHHGHVKSGYTKIPKEWNTENSQWKLHHTLDKKTRYKRRSDTN